MEAGECDEIFYAVSPFPLFLKWPKYVSATNADAAKEISDHRMNTLFQAPCVSNTRYGTTNIIIVVPTYPMPSINPVDDATTPFFLNLDGIVQTKNT